MKHITPSALRGSVKAPPSKSMMGRALAAAFLSGGTCTIENPSFCDDARATMKVVRTLGASLDEAPHQVIVDSATKGHVPHDVVLDCGESALCMRMFAPIAALQERSITLTASGTLRSRPMDMIEAIRGLGVFFSSTGGYAPLRIRGPLKGGYIGIDGFVSSQLLTGLLLSLPLCREASRISAYNLRSLPYVKMTIGLLGHFGIRIDHDEKFEEFEVPAGQVYVPFSYRVEGDWSGASFLLVAGALSGPVTVTGLDISSAQADRAILHVLEQAGAGLYTGSDYVTVYRKDLKAFEFDVTDCPDLFPPLAALALNCEGTSVIFGIERLRHKESNRLAALGHEIGNLGGVMHSLASRVEIHGGPLLGGIADSHGDHRIAMAMAVAGLMTEKGVDIMGHASVQKSYPGFFRHLEILQVKG